MKHILQNVAAAQGGRAASVSHGRCAKTQAHKNVQDQLNTRRRCIQARNRITNLMSNPPRYSLKLPRGGSDYQWAYLVARNSKHYDVETVKQACAVLSATENWIYKDAARSALKEVSERESNWHMQALAMRAVYVIGAVWFVGGILLLDATF